MLPLSLWTEILSFMHRDWFEPPRPATQDVHYLRRRLAEEQAATQRAQAARAAAESRMHLLERERDIYRHLTLRWQQRLRAVLQEHLQRPATDSVGGTEPSTAGVHNPASRASLTARLRELADVDIDDQMFAGTAVGNGDDLILAAAAAVFGDDHLIIRLNALRTMAQRFARPDDDEENEMDHGEEEDADLDGLDRSNTMTSQDTFRPMDDENTEDDGPMDDDDQNTMEDVSSASSNEDDHSVSTLALSPPLSSPSYLLTANSFGASVRPSSVVSPP
jgi:hypothetical protein